MPKLRVHNFSISLDGYAAGPDQGPEHPLGVGGDQLHKWAFATRTFRQMFGEDGTDEADESIDDRFAAQGDVGIGATVMGRNMFGPIRGSWGDEQWRGWWGDDPPYHHPVFVLTHHPRAPTSCTWRSHRSCSAAASGSSTTSRGARPATSAWSSSARRRRPTCGSCARQRTGLGRCSAGQVVQSTATSSAAHTVMPHGQRRPPRRQ
jgi:dihydrofolate reductase